MDHSGSRAPMCQPMAPLQGSHSISCPEKCLLLAMTGPTRVVRRCEQRRAILPEPHSDPQASWQLASWQCHAWQLASWECHSWQLAAGQQGNATRDWLVSSQLSKSDQKPRDRIICQDLSCLQFHFVHEEQKPPRQQTKKTQPMLASSQL